MATSRETARDALVGLLTTALKHVAAGDDKPAKEVTGSKVTSLEGQTPLVVVLSRGSAREAITFRGDHAIFSFVIQLWVLQSGDNWTYAEAEDALDSIEALVAGLCETYRKTDDWASLRYDGSSNVVEFAVSGIPYYMESIPVEIRLGRD